ncbi:MAG TPA: class I SAM-dependent methyltransferase [Devosiaceae bacterium]
MVSSKSFWDKQSSSLGRDSSAEFYRRKAAEHSEIITKNDHSVGIVDLGCGAGELLQFLAEKLRIEKGIDYSASMIQSARVALARFPDITFEQADIFQYLPLSAHAVWMSTAAIDQYLNASDTQKFLTIFANNQSARSLYLFDCIDPVRYRLMSLGISYRPEDAVKFEPTNTRKRLSLLRRRSEFAAKLVTGGLAKEFVYLGTPEMGYGALPRFWLKAAKSLGLSVEIVSSRYYEYRYHVTMRKSGR